MTEEIQIQVDRRDVVGKKVRRLRREGLVPGIVYGTGIEPVPVQLDAIEISTLYRQAGTSTLLQLLLGEEDETRPAFIRTIQRDPISLDILHVDFQVVDMSQPITAKIPVVLIGSAPVASESMGVVTQALEELEVQCLPGNIPHHFDVDLSVLERMDQSIHVSDLEEPEGVEILTDPDTVIVYIAVIRTLEEEEEEAEEEVPLFDLEGEEIEMEEGMEEEEEEAAEEAY